MSNMKIVTLKEDIVTEPFDPSEHLGTPEQISEFISSAMETRDPAYIARAFGVAARAKGMTQLSRETGLSRHHLYDALSEDGNPTLKTLLAVSVALGVDLRTAPHQDH